MQIIVRIILVQCVFAYAVTALAIRDTQSQITLLRRSPAGGDSRKWPITKTGKEIERKMMREHKDVRTPQARETMIRTELVRHGENARTAGQEKARLEQKMSQKKHTLDSFKGKALSILPNTAEHKLKKAIGQIKKSNTAVQNISKDLDFHQRKGNIHDMSSISQTIQEIQSGGKKRYSNKEASSSGSSRARAPERISQSQPVSRTSSPTRPLLRSTHTASHVATPARSPMHAQQVKSSSRSAGPSRASSPYRAQTPRRGRV
ncbi:uncharacterized protein FA14DRAFT_176954 [Meira miltonrushii]|uniref:Uncharacterized protein n=1 Tax=Meira miltonrushii TaxID=1280837 RepID=A0A316VJ17_9BASI|nr:uncharacterized protein FA14DRAFT_176954 [Meira miltonrushii]PWN37667.1 hypothetical protein FA14DRAFT_176954 [Meira miltonrushii]